MEYKTVIDKAGSQWIGVSRDEARISSRVLVKQTRKWNFPRHHQQLGFAIIENGKLTPLDRNWESKDVSVIFGGKSNISFFVPLVRFDAESCEKHPQVNAGAFDAGTFHWAGGNHYQRCPVCVIESWD